jgi:iron complex outermembrane receptor protein
MKHIQKIYSLFALMLLTGLAYGQGATNSNGLTLTVLNEQAKPAVAATVELLKDNKLIKAAITDINGEARFEKIGQGSYTFKVSFSNYQTQISDSYVFPSVNTATITLKPATTTLKEVSIAARKPFIEQKPGKVVLNVDASVTNIGSTVLEVLEKSPGVTVDRNGGIALQGKAGVLVLIDDKQTYLSGAELNNLLSSMSSSQVELIELMSNPPAKYDASGNAGVINIKTKKNKAKGFNGSFTISAGQGIYPKNNNSLQLNYRTGKFNMFLNYSMNLNKYLTNIYALRKYYDDNGILTAVLDQPTYFSGHFINNTLKAGVDYYVTPKTTIGMVLGGTAISRKGKNDARATWLDAAGNVDSAIATNSTSNNKFRSSLVNLNLRHNMSSTQDIAVDLDWLNYAINSKQQFNNEFQAPGGYKEASRGDIPAAIKIVSGKIDHTVKMSKSSSLQSGWKSSHISTDNSASYQKFDGTAWNEDYGKSNHFIYKENIHALYSSLETKYKRFSMQGGLRYEYTAYNAHQLGNVIQKDSAFSRNYSGLFPGAAITYQADSSNGFTFTAGRRIDRPAFQKLNPFYTIINKYTYQTGNPFFLPQYSWNLQLSHQYKNVLTTAVSYSIIKNYFSQLFLTDTVKNILFYSEGNVGKAHNLGLSATLVVSPFKWWSLTAQANYNHKELKGYNGNVNFTSEINQLNININNQFTVFKKYNAEVSGFYTTRARNDLQEVLYPTGQLSLGVSRPVLKKKGTLKFSARDIFYTNAMEGLTQFDNATEYFILRRDSRVFNLSFTYRFGKAYKTVKRTSGSAADEIERAGNG